MKETKMSSGNGHASQSPLEVALDYAGFGWPVLLLHSIDGGRCTCGRSDCHSVAKHPRTEHGLRDATTDQSIMRSWWSRCPNANVGILTGQRSGFVVLDVDPQHGGSKTLSDLEGRFGRLPKTLVSRTGNGGRHILFQHPGYYVKTKQGALGAGLDIKGDGGYIVAPPSLHRSGQHYRWEGSGPLSAFQIAPLPAWIVKRLEKAEGKQPGKARTSAQRIPEGQRNTALTSLGGAMRRQGMCQEAIESALLAENRRRCTPPLSDTEVKRIAASVARYPEASKPGLKDGKGHTQTTAQKRDAKSDRASCATQLIDIARSRCVDLFTDDTDTPFVRVPVNGHLEIWPLYSRRFEHWVSGIYHQLFEKAPYGQALADARRVLGGICDRGPTCVLHNRVAGHWGQIWYDLADKSWRAVRITAGGCNTVEKPPLLFRRYGHQQPQVQPAAGGDVRLLLELLNLPEDEELRLLVLVYLVSCFVPDISHPILILTGPQGSAKSTVFRLLRSVVDPSATGTLSFPRKPQELVQQLQHNWVAYFDNVTNLPPWLSDTLCRASTGNGISKRRLYTDDEDIIYRYKRVVGINGIVNPAIRPDLLDRCIVIQLEHVRDGVRRTDAELQAEFNKNLPLILGACFDTLAKAMAFDPTPAGVALPRMADFAERGLCIARALGYKQEQFLEAYRANIGEMNELAIESQPFIQAIRGLLGSRNDQWEGTPTQLLEEAERAAGQLGISTEEKKWPKSATWATRRLTEGQINLQEAGYEVSFQRRDHNSQRTVSIKRRTVSGR